VAPVDKLLSAGSILVRDFKIYRGLIIPGSYYGRNKKIISNHFKKGKKCFL